MAPRGKNNNSNWFAFGIVLGVLATVFSAYFFELFFSAQLWEKIKDDAPTILALIVAFGSLIISYRMFLEQRLTRQAGTDPVILVRLGSREDARILATLEIENVGAGAARNVSVTLQTDLSAYFPDRIITDFSTLKKIRVIPQGVSVSYNFGMGFRLLENPQIPIINFLVSYEDIEGEPYSSLQMLDVSELEGQRADDGMLSKISKSLENIEKAAKNGFPSSKPSQVIVQTIEKHREEEAEHRAQLFDHLKKQKED